MAETKLGMDIGRPEARTQPRGNRCGKALGIAEIDYGTRSVLETSGPGMGIGEAEMPLAKAG
jgi:hypothetical protein